jgi:hypothetical protein
MEDMLHGYCENTPAPYTCHRPKAFFRYYPSKQRGLADEIF